MAGSAMFTTLESSTTISWLTAIAVRTRAGRSRDGVVEEVDM